jgi:hypothetical protein
MDPVEITPALEPVLHKLTEQEGQSHPSLFQEDYILQAALEAKRGLSVKKTQN